MAEKIRFTQERIRNLPTPLTGRVDYYDTQVPKLTCRVSSTGNKSFVVLKKNAAGTVQRITLGRFPDWSVDKARTEAVSGSVTRLHGCCFWWFGFNVRLNGCLFNVRLDNLVETCASKEQDMKKMLNWICIALIGSIVLAAEPTLAQNLTGSQSNAVRSANQYLSISGFSRNGLIRQLSSDAGDGYEVADATVAVDSLNINWNMQAVRSAKQYLSISGFSCKGLINQLSSNAGGGYTESQATYGAQQAGAC